MLLAALRLNERRRRISIGRAHKQTRLHHFQRKIIVQLGISQERSAILNTVLKKTPTTTMDTFGLSRNVTGCDTSHQ
jgi:hypothetical protein